MAASKKANQDKKAKPAKRNPSPVKRRRRGVKLEPTQLTAPELVVTEPSAAVAELAELVRSDGGAVLAIYKEPLGGHELLLVSLPIEQLEPTPFQRDVSDTHVRKLTRAMDKTQRFLDPVIMVRGDDGYRTPNGNHRLTALRELGAKAVIGLLVPEARVAYHILALNIEKAHNLRERALEVARMYRDLATFATESEPAFELEFEEANLISLGFAYERRGRLAGGTYHPVLRKVDTFIDAPLAEALPERQRRAERILQLDDAVSAAVAKLKEKGLTSPYLKPFVVARINPLRFIKGDPPTFDALLDSMTRKAEKLNVDKITTADLAKSGGARDDE